MSAGLPLTVPALHGGGLLRLARLTWQRRSGYGLLAMAAVVLIGPFLSYAYVLSPGAVRLDVSVLARLLNAAILVCALAMADTAVVHGARPVRSYVAGLLLGGVLGAVLQWHVLEWLAVGTPGRPLDLPVHERRTQMLYALAGNLMLGALLTWLHVEWRAGRRAADAMRGAQRELMAQSQEAETARLLALQSRVEPQWLFDALSRTRGLWRRAPEPAAALLDDLIATLRSAMPPPGLRPTLARELALVLGQMRVRRALNVEQMPALAVDVPDALGGARLAPMLLWPLLQWLAAAQAGPTDWRWQGEARARDEGSGRLLQLTLHAPAADWPADDAPFALLRARLRAVHGASAALLREPAAPGAVRVVLRVDLEDGSHDTDRADR